MCQHVLPPSGANAPRFAGGMCANMFHVPNGCGGARIPPAKRGGVCFSEALPPCALRKGAKASERGGPLAARRLGPGSVLCKSGTIEG